MEWDEVYKQNYKNKAFWNIHWLNSARCLLAAANVLERNIMEIWDNLQAYSAEKNIGLKADYFQGPYFMLVAFALENLFKAIMVRENSWVYKQQFQQNNKFPKELKSHDLVKLARKANYQFNIEDEDLLRRLTRHAIWAGRYPVPLDYKRSLVAERFSDGKQYHVSWFGYNDVYRLKVLISKVAEHSGLNDT